MKLSSKNRRTVKLKAKTSSTSRYVRKINPRVVLYALNRKTGAVLHFVGTDVRGRGKFSNKGTPHYYRGAPEARLAARSFVDQFPSQFANYTLYWK